MLTDTMPYSFRRTYWENNGDRIARAIRPDVRREPTEFHEVFYRNDDAIACRH